MRLDPKKYTSVAVAFVAFSVLATTRACPQEPLANNPQYMTIIYRMIKEKFHVTPDLRLEFGKVTKKGAIDFYLDRNGSLVSRRLVDSSGVQDLDIAVMNAIADAAPYPTPPTHQSLHLTYTFGKL